MKRIGELSCTKCSLSRTEIDILEKTIEGISDILENCDILLRDGTYELIRKVVTDALLQEGNLAREEILKAMKDVEHEVHRILKFTEKVG
jgi:hypothetical protein